MMMDQGEAYLWKQRAQTATDALADLNERYIALGDEAAYQRSQREKAEAGVNDLRGVLDIALALMDEMAQHIEATKPLLCMVTLESDNKPPSPEIARANHLLARWDEVKPYAPVRDNYVGPPEGRPTLPICRECDQSIHPDERMASNDDGDWHADCANAPFGR